MRCIPAETDGLRHVIVVVPIVVLFVTLVLSRNSLNVVLFRPDACANATNMESPAESSCCSTGELTCIAVPFTVIGDSTRVSVLPRILIRCLNTPSPPVE